MADAGNTQRWLVAGLGNPGPTYAKTRHNVGARAVQLLAERWGLSFREKDGLLWAAAEKDDGATAFLALPQTYMNASGEVLAPFLRYRNVPPANLVAVVDDLDLPPGRVRVRPGGSSGGHHGLDSIISHLGTDAFPRVRLGVGKPPSGADGPAWVLSDFPAADKPVVEESIARAVDAVIALLENGVEEAMRQFNGHPPERKQP